MDKPTVVVLGASPKPQRFSNQAVRLLIEHGYRVIPVHPIVEQIENLPVVKNIGAITERVHTVTVYVGPEHSAGLVQDILALNPKRVVMNPGAESQVLEDALSKHDIEVVTDCTLVMLRSGRF